jgi:hypothetical protein
LKFVQLKRYDSCCDLFTELSAYELKYGMHEDDQNYAFMIEALLGRPAAACELTRLTRSQLMCIVMAPVLLGADV